MLQVAKQDSLTGEGLPGEKKGSERAVSRILSARANERQGRGSFVLAASTRNRQATIANDGPPVWSGQPRGFLFGLAPDGVFRAPSITLGAVGSYPTF